MCIITNTHEHPSHLTDHITYCHVIAFSYDKKRYVGWSRYSCPRTPFPSKQDSTFITWVEEWAVNRWLIWTNENRPQQNALIGSHQQAYDSHSHSRLLKAHSSIKGSQQQLELWAVDLGHWNLSKITAVVILVPSTHQKASPGTKQHGKVLKTPSSNATNNTILSKLGTVKMLWAVAFTTCSCNKGHNKFKVSHNHSQGTTSGQKPELEKIENGKLRICLWFLNCLLFCYSLVKRPN